MFGRVAAHQSNHCQHDKKKKRHCELHGVSHSGSSSASERPSNLRFDAQDIDPCYARASSAKGECKTSSINSALLTVLVSRSMSKSVVSAVPSEPSSLRSTNIVSSSSGDNSSSSLRVPDL